MPGDNDNFYYSISFGEIHFIAFSTEFSFYPEDDDYPMSNMG